MHLQYFPNISFHRSSYHCRRKNDRWNGQKGSHTRERYWVWQSFIQTFFGWIFFLSNFFKNDLNKQFCSKIGQISNTEGLVFLQTFRKNVVAVNGIRNGLEEKDERLKNGDR